MQHTLSFRAQINYRLVIERAVEIRQENEDTPAAVCAWYGSIQLYCETYLVSLFSCIFHKLTRFFFYLKRFSFVAKRLLYVIVRGARKASTKAERE